MSRSTRPPTAETRRRFAMAFTTASAVFALAAPAAQADTAVQGEWFSISSSKGYDFADRTASGGRTLKIHSNASASRSVAVATSSVKLIVRARGQMCEGAPKMTVHVDGIRRVSETVVNSAYAGFSSVLTLPAGTHTIKAAFTNDLKTSRCDRNLLIDSLQLVSASAATQPPAPTTPSQPTGTTSTPPPATTPPVVAPTPPVVAPTPPPPTSTPTPAPTVPAGEQLRPDYDAAWGTANYANGAIGPFRAAVHRERISIVDDPAGLNRKVARFAPKDSDIGPTENPRTQIELPRFIDEDEEVWQGVSMFYASNFPQQVSSSSGGSFVTHTSNSAPPHSGTTPVSFGSFGGAYKFGARLFGSGTYAWSVTPRVGVWHDFVLRKKFSRQGFIEVWHNTGSGLVKQPMTNSGAGGTYGSVSADGKRWIGNTLDPQTHTPPLDSRLSLYWKRGMWNVDPVLFYGPAKWRVRQSADSEAALLDSVNPRSYG